MTTEKVSTGRKLKVYSLIDKVYHPTNLKMAWKKVRANKGAGGIDGIYIDEFEKVAEMELKALHADLKEESYVPLPVKRVYIPKRGKPKECRALGIPTIRDRVCQQALRNRLEPIFEETFNDCSFGYRPGRSPHHAMRKIWQEINRGNRWIVDGDVSDYFGTVDHETLIDMVAEKVSDGKVLSLVRKMLKAGYIDRKRKFETKTGTPQGSVISPLISNIYLTPFDDAMTAKGFKLTRFADDWLITCKSKAEAERALKTAREELGKLGLALNSEGKVSLRLGTGVAKRQKDKIRQITRRNRGKSVDSIIAEINVAMTGFINYFKLAQREGWKAG
jgi:RNA-directed DNA polymerase